MRHPTLQMANLNATKTSSVRLHPRTSYSAAVSAHKLRNKVHEAAQADKCFAEADYAACAHMCYQVLQAEPSEAIRARCHMYLAREDVGMGGASVRAYHAAMAMQAWGTVIERTGISRFPVGKAKEGLEVAGELFAVANALVDTDEEVDSRVR